MNSKRLFFISVVIFAFIFISGAQTSDAQNALYCEGAEQCNPSLESGGQCISGTPHLCDCGPVDFPICQAIFSGPYGPVSECMGYYVGPDGTYSFTAYCSNGESCECYYPTPAYTYPTPEYTYPTPAYVYPTPDYPYPTPAYVYPTPDYPYPTPAYAYPTPEYVYPTPAYVYPTPEYVYPTPEYPYPTPDVKYPYPTPAYAYPTPEYVYPTPAYVYPTPAYAYPTPAYTYPTPAYTYPTPAYTYPTPAYPYPTPAYVYPTPAYTYPTPDPYPTPVYPYPTPVYSYPYPYPTPYETPYGYPTPYPTPTVNLSSSDKDVSAVNGVANPGISACNGGFTADVIAKQFGLIRSADLITFKISICNSGDASASIQRVTDTFTNLIKPSSGWNARYNGTEDINNTISETKNSQGVVTGITFNFSPNKTVPPRNGSNPGVGSITFQAQVYNVGSTASGLYRFQNRATIVDATGSTLVMTPLFLFSTGAGSPDLKEVAP